ncbi:uncharacterized protein MONOS_1025 [Monocercomonoides exilis]|uniref:uncharacterized protein n=1 Tax=Monocercomonoides exilis TaxID=2049356 RepID=UPI00355A8FF8|nr:hypothetical protein MONOS_1025 [Monocercomonoides exilis]|eukprot:MONOS_1025.1-p1 / transcript=MONOS_1025.1 / gene=MONOS_1025 / organism=Monocercomonoides_exilis_PA203 / gene_product=unspecified product / transcript_product=unspecified product / location=Mono_scaffold00017:88183-96569(-) / protein_length=2646 / sequence_SO=supercontig / SO=protein_coding / is_pseudo=false
MNDLNELCGYENGDENNVIPLVLFFRSEPGEYFVGGSNKRDWYMCGYVDQQCKTLNYAVEEHATTSGIKVSINNGTNLRKELSFEFGNIIVKGQAHNSRFIIDEDSQSFEEGFISTRTTTFFEVRNAECFSCSLITCAGGTVSLISSTVNGLSFSSSCVIELVKSGGGVISKTNFTNLELSSDIALIKYNSVGTLKIDQTLFERIGSEENGVIMSQQGSCLDVDNCIFKDIHLSEGDGSGINCVIGGNQKLSICNCNFSGCQALKGNGGALFVEIGGESQIRADKGNNQTVIENCEANQTESKGGCGGGIFVKCNENGNNDFKFCLLHFGALINSNKASRSGYNIFIDSQSLFDTITKDRFVGVISTLEANDNEAMGIEGGNEKYLIPLRLFLLDDFSFPGYVGGDNSRDFSGCGFKGYPCFTVGKIVTLRFESKNKDIVLNSGFVCNECIEMKENIWDMKCLEKETKIEFAFIEGNSFEWGIKTIAEVVVTNISFLLSTSLALSSSFIVCLSQMLSLNSCGMKISDIEQNSRIGFSFLKIEGGSLKIDDFLFDESTFMPIETNFFNIGDAASVALNNSYLKGIEHVGGSGGCLIIKHTSSTGRIVSLKNCTISSKCSSGNRLCGGGFMCFLSGRNKLRMEAMKLEKCNVPNDESEETGKGLGGGIFLYEEDGAYDFSLAELSFISCNAWKGNNIFLNGKDFVEAINTQSFAFNIGSMSRSDLMGYERDSTNVEFAIPLCAYLDDFNGTAFIGGSDMDGFDHSGCGVEYAPCRTIPKAVLVRFPAPSSFVKLKIKPGYTLIDYVKFQLRTFEICGFLNEEMTSISISDSGRGDQEGFIETVSQTCIKNLSFSLPSVFVASQRTSLIYCMKEMLRIEDCSFYQIDQLSNISFCLIKANGGNIAITRLKLVNMKFNLLPTFELNNCHAVIEVLKVEKVKSESSQGLIVLESSSLQMEKSVLNDSTFENGCLIFFDEGSGLSITNSSFLKNTRQSGNGGVLKGTVGQTKNVNVINCTFDTELCTGIPSSGGCGLFAIRTGGSLTFDLNNVQNCAVVGEMGFGGGLFIEFEDDRINYSMRSNNFCGNAAIKGSDVFLICSAPGSLLIERLWLGTIDETETPERNFWVVDSLVNSVIDLSIKKFLFPTESTTVFIEAGQSSDGQLCGSEIVPCDKLIDGFLNMADNKTTIQINNHNSLNATINRRGKSLSVRGKMSECELEICEHGCFCLTEGNRDVFLTLSRLLFNLPQTLGRENEALVCVSVGVMTMISCAFKPKENILLQTEMNIIKNAGGEVRFDHVSIDNISFSVCGGIIKLVGDSFIANNSIFSLLNGEGEGLIIGESLSTLELSNINASEICVKDGGLIIECYGASVTIQDCKFKRCCSTTGNGGILLCEMNEQSSFTFARDETECCCVNMANGRGGALFLDIQGETDGNIFLNDLSFSSNDGAEGKDLFVDCVNLNNTVRLEKFKFSLADGDNNPIVDAKGVDDGRFSKHAVDLLLFLIQFKSTSIYLSSNGYDMIGCGSADYPCVSFWRSIHNLHADIFDQTKLFVNGSATVKNSFDMSGIIVNSVTPFEFDASVVIEECFLREIKTPEGREGGCMKIYVKEDHSLIINNSVAENCECSLANGKGGVIYLDCSSSLISEPFCLRTVKFAGNDAKIGKVMFLLSRDLNESITTSSFSFDYSLMKEDSNLFVGSDKRINNSDLFRFIVAYSNITIYISSDGFDVMRCGSKEDPCFSFWKGMQQIKPSEIMKEILLSGTITINNEWNLTNHILKTSDENEKENSKASLTFLIQKQSDDMSFISNFGFLNISEIIFIFSNSGASDEKVIIESGGKLLIMNDCEVKSNFQANEALASFLIVKSGEVMLKALKVSQLRVSKSFFIFCEGVKCNIEKLSATSLSFSKSSLVLISGDNTFENAGSIFLSMSESSIRMLERESNGPCVIESSSTKFVSFVVNESVLESCQSRESEYGGGIYFQLNEDSEFKIFDTRISQSNCSMINGMGGGIYLRTELLGELNYLFFNLSFSGNNAWIGRDIFIECTNISAQINESQFKMDLRQEVFIRSNAIFGSDKNGDFPIDLIELITIYQSATIVVSNVNGKGGNNTRKCGISELPCLSVGYGLDHIIEEFNSMLAVDGESEIEKEIELKSLTMRSKGISPFLVSTRDYVVSVSGHVVIELVNIQFSRTFPSTYKTIFFVAGMLSILSTSFNSRNDNFFEATIPTLIESVSGKLTIGNCTVSNIASPYLMHLSTDVVVRQLKVENIHCSSDLITLTNGNWTFNEFDIFNATINEGSIFKVYSESRDNVCVLHSILQNVSRQSSGTSIMSCISPLESALIGNCTIKRSCMNREKGSIVSIKSCCEMILDSCLFDGEYSSDVERCMEDSEDACEWDGSIVHFENSSVIVKDTSIKNAKDGGVSISGGDVSVEKGEFLNNNPGISKFPSVRRNIICSDEGLVKIESLKGGDGQEKYSSLWFLNEGCKVGGIASERISTLFIPILKEVKSEKKGSVAELRFIGNVLIPCELSFKVSSWIGDAEAVERHEFSEADFVSEKEVCGSISSTTIESAPNEAEVTVAIVFGKKEEQHSTPFVLKNRTEKQTENYDNLVERKNSNSLSWSTIVLAVILLLMEEVKDENRRARGNCE